MKSVYFIRVVCKNNTNNLSEHENMFVDHDTVIYDSQGINDFRRKLEWNYRWI